MGMSICGTDPPTHTCTVQTINVEKRELFQLLTTTSSLVADRRSHSTLLINGLHCLPITHKPEMQDIVLLTERNHGTESSGGLPSLQKTLSG